MLRQVLPTPDVVNNVVLYNALFDVPNPDHELLPQMSAQVFFVLADAKQVGLQENAQPITAIVINKEGTRVATAEADNIIRTWDATKIDEKVEPKLVTKGRIGIRQMSTKQSIYKDFKVERL